MKEKLGGLGKKRTSSKHLWRTNRDAKDSHLCLQNHLLSLSVSVSLVLTLIHCSFFTYAPFVLRKIQAWQLRTLGPFGWNICSALAAFYKSGDLRWAEMKQRDICGFKQSPYMDWYYRLRRVFIVNNNAREPEGFQTWHLNYWTVSVYFCENA